MEVVSVVFESKDIVNVCVYVFSLFYCEFPEDDGIMSHFNF